jgi:drug/metabolite transporter (DMT)-like permease
MKGSEIVHFVLVVSIEFLFSAGYMFFNKEFLKIVPHPTFVTFANSLAVVPLSLLYSWSSHKFTRSFSFLVPPPMIFGWLATGGIIESLSAILNTLGYFASALDFVILMRLSGLVWNGVFGFLFFGERLSLLGFVSVALIFLGVLLVASNFQWSVAVMGSRTQIAIQLLGIFISSVTSLVNKKILGIIYKINTPFRLLEYVAWQLLLSLPSIFIISVWQESDAWTDLQAVISWRTLKWTAFGSVLHQTAHWMFGELHKISSLISVGVIAQLRLLVTLGISHFVYGETTWTQTRFTGVALLTFGGISYSLTRLEARATDLLSDEEPVFGSEQGTFSPDGDSHR